MSDEPFEDDPYFQIYGWQVGRVLSEKDHETLQRHLNDHNDMIGEHADEISRIRYHTILEIGGLDLVKAMKRNDQAQAEKIVKRATANAYEKMEAAKIEMNQ